MSGTILVLLVAFFVAGRDALSKLILVKEQDEYVVCWATALLTFVFLLPTLFFVPFSFVREGFLLSLFLGAALNFLARLIFLKAIKGADLSLVAPLLSFSPVFIMITAPLLSREVPTVQGAVGAGLMLAGSCALTVKKGEMGYKASAKSMLMQKWARLGMAVALIWGMAGLVDKAGIYDSSPLFWAVCVQGLMVILGLPLVAVRMKGRGDNLVRSLKPLVPVGLCNAVVIAFYVMALSLSQVSFVFTLYQTNMLFSIILGWLIFKEKNIAERLKGAGVMLAGVMVMTAL